MKVPVSGVYTLYAEVDDGFRMNVGNQTVFDVWGTVSSEINTKIYLDAEIPYPLSLEYLEVSDDATIVLSWALPESGDKTVIPSSAFYYERHLDGSPLDVVIYPGSVDASTSIAFDGVITISRAGEVRGLSDAVAGVESVFTIQARDSGHNNRYNHGDDVFQVSLTGVSDWASVGRTNEVWKGSPHFLQFTHNAHSNAIRSGSRTPNAWSKLCPSCGTIVHGGNVLLTSSNLTQVLDRGDVVLIGDEVFTVSNDTRIVNMRVVATCIWFFTLFA